MSISQNSALFAILGTTYGGDGQTTFGLPDLMDRAAMHWGQGPGLTPRVLGEQLGTRTVTLIGSEMPSHSHSLLAEASGTVSQQKAEPTSAAWLGLASAKVYDTTTPGFDVGFSNNAIGVGGGSSPHQNMQPVLALNFCIALNGIFPPHN